MILAHHLFEARNGDTSRLANFGSDLIVALNQHAASIGQPNHKVGVSTYAPDEIVLKLIWV